MWINELSNLYLEQGGFGPNTTNQPRPVYGLKGTVDDKNSRDYKGIFGAGGSPAGLAKVAEAEPVSFYAPAGEQEEDQMISKNYVLTLINQHMERGESDSMDNATLHHLAQLKQAIKRL